MAVLGRVDALIFTGGIGEHSARIREQVCSNLQSLGITLDSVRNQQPCDGIVECQEVGAVMKVLVVPTNEEWAIALSTAAFG